jgi:arabinofuranan 3-O-arabinosyltransferase
MMLRRHGPVALLVLLAYLPALTAAPGRMPADSKLYLYLDPRGFLTDAASTFDPGQFAGWVPHQHISYLWPAGPWFWLHETLGVPDWIAHRLWIGTLMVLAGLGVRWCTRLLGLGGAACLAAALVYQVSLYVLPYVSRTSVMLLPWVGLGWIVGLAIRATSRRTWGDPAAIALVVMTVGAVNATALAMIVPAPVIWLLHEGWRRAISWRQAVVVAVRVAILCVGVSLWWIAALVIQGRYGAEVLPYSESLADVSSTATSAEVWRGLGYWLFYVRDPFTATTTESLRYLSSTPAILVSFLVPVVCLVGLVWVRWAHRRFAAALVVAGGVLAVGVHPVDDRSPLMRVLAGSDDGGLALALRSSTRALPLLFLGLALAAAALVDAAPRPRADRVLALAIGVLVLANVPGLWTGAFVDPALERDQDPPDAWVAAARVLDADGTDGRVLMVPGVEFGAYRWGYTVDQPLPGLADSPLVTRDLLPLGSPAAMDLLFALDDRIQDGVLEPAALAPIARLLGADTIWSTNDVAFDRFRTARPEVVRDAVAAAPGVDEPVGFGQPVANAPDLAMIDERSIGDPRVGAALSPVELADVDGAAIVRAKDTTVLVSGSGDGLVDLAAAGLIDGDAAVRYSASTDGAAPPEVAALIVTDSNRARARHWRSSQDTRGLTEPGPLQTGLTERPASDRRLPVFDEVDHDAVTYAEQRSPVQAIASSYGEPFAYLPEHRPFMAIDGDPDTAWLVGEHGDPIGESIQLWLDPAKAPAEMRLRQPHVDGARRITRVHVRFDAMSDRLVEERPVDLGDDSVAPEGQPLAVPPGTTAITVTITGVGGGEPFTAGAVAGVGFSEIDLGLPSGREVVRVPTDALDALDPSTPLAYSFTRWRVDAMDRWRDDPEPSLARSFEVPSRRSFTPEVEVRLDARAPDADLAALFGWPVAASTRLTGSLEHVGAAAFDGDPDTAWVTGFDAAVGAVLTVGEVGRPVSEVTIDQPTGDFSAVRAIRISVGDEHRTVSLSDGATTTAVLDPPLPAGPLEITLAEVEISTTIDRRFADAVALPASIAEISFDGAPRVDLDAAPVLECVTLAEVGGSPLSATVDLAGWRDSALRGEPLDATACTRAVELTGDVLLTSTDLGVPLELDRVVLDDGVRRALAVDGDARAETVDGNRFGRTIEVTGCTDGCWLVFGEGFNEGWSASAGGVDLGAPALVDGGFNGWWLEPGTERVTVRWGLQRNQNLALAVSLVVGLVAVVLLALDRRNAVATVIPAASAPTWTWEREPSRRSGWSIVALWTLPALLLAGPAWALLGLVGGLVAQRYRRVPLGALTTLAAVAVIGLAVTYLERRDAPYPGGGWPATFESLHWIGMFAFATLASSALTDEE